MVDENNNTEQTFSMEKIFVKGLLFEAFNPAPAASEAARPHVDIQMSTQSRKLEADRYEVVLEVKLDAKNNKDDSESLYRLELRQAGRYVLQNFSESDLATVLNVVCPNILFPYARHQISSTIQDGGYPELILAPVNFESLYRDYQSRQNAESADQSTPTTQH